MHLLLGSSRTIERADSRSSALWGGVDTVEHSPANSSYQRVEIAINKVVRRPSLRARFGAAGGAMLNVTR
ncbi:MAG TPA: hypothetical protein VF945_15260, partial [Polyangia bacterium]